MLKAFLFILSLSPGLVSAHPDHSQGTYSLLHYLGGTHLFLGLAVVAVTFLTYRSIKRFYLR